MSRAVGQRVAVLLVLLAAVAVFPAVPARADGAAEARRQAAAAADEVARLQPRVQAALRAYEASLHDLATDVSAGLSAQAEAQQLQQAAAVANAQRTNRLRALYMSGGGAAVLASVLDATSPSDLLDRLDTVQRLVQDDSATAAVATEQARAVQAVADVHLARAERKTVTASDVEAEALRLQGLLADAQARLDRLSAQARALEAAQQAAAALAAARAEAAAAGSLAAATATGRDIPADYLALYRRAASTCGGMDWHVLAAVGQVESGHGRNVGPSSSGAEGPMQFLPSTFAAYAVDGDGNGVVDIWSPADSVFTAAHYLCANGAGSPTKLYTALWHYNHADWYVQMVLRIAADLTSRYP